MFRVLQNRFGHYLLLMAVAAGLCFLKLGTPSLWDIDEGNNAEAAREMLESRNWIVPTFNYEWRPDKPALLYWLQTAAYQLVGVNEWGARLPSALAALVTVLVAYELGRRLFDPATGLLGGLILTSAVAFAVSAHFANPDALLNLCTVLTLGIFWHGFVRKGRGWFVPAGISAGLGVLAKGPVALVLPAGVIGLFLLWCRERRRLHDRRLLHGAAAFALVTLPWYVWVTNDTKARFLRDFILVHNVGRYLSPMEHHNGPIFYYLGALVLGFAPWSVFLVPASWFATGHRARADAQPASGYRFLWCWIAVYLVFFSLAGTKLPNYILPAYVPIALLTARFLERWRQGAIPSAPWMLHGGVVGLMLLGLGVACALLLLGGTRSWPRLEGRQLQGMASWAGLGMVPIAGALLGTWCLRRGQSRAFLVTLTTTAMLFIGLLLGGASLALDAHKAPRALVAEADVQQPTQDIRVACYEYFQPSLVFYCQREVQRLPNETQTLEFLQGPLPSYLFLPATVWDSLQTKVAGNYHVLAKHQDLYRHREVVVVLNR
jgi:4-amino-4-deoxy-L-arabinose transferase-like glycosyltransferase